MYHRDQWHKRCPPGGNDEEQRLLAIVAACHAAVLAAAAELSNPPDSMLHSTYTRKSDILSALRLKRDESSIVLRAYREKMRD